MSRIFRISSSTRIHPWQRRVVGLGVLVVAAGSYVYLLSIHQQALAGTLHGDDDALLPTSSFKHAHAAIRPFQEQLQQHRSQQAVHGVVKQQQQQQHHETVVTLNTISKNSDTSTILRNLPVRKSYARISFELHDGFTFNNTFNPLVKCDRINGKRLPLHEEMKNARGVLDFTTHITTDLKILFMGDSVGMQFSQGLEEATGVVAAVVANNSDRTVHRYSWGEHEGLHLSAPVRGGGVVAGWRITDFFKAQGQNQPLPNWPGGGWVMDDVEALLQHAYYGSNTTSSLGGGETTPHHHHLRHTVDKFDVLVFRIPHGWIELTKITVEALQETIDLAHALFHVSCVVFVSLPFINNVVEQWQLDMLAEKNTLLRDFAQTFNNNSDSRSSSGVQHVAVLEFGRFTDALMEWNAKILGMNTTNNDDWILEPLRCCPHKGYRRHIAHVCGEAVPRKAPRCDRNAVSYDGMHWCMETIAGRLYAGVACLLGCVFNRPPSGNKANDDSLRTCDKRCNEQYMSLTPIADSEIIK